jgi:nitrate reductase alpha subunit
MIIIGAAMNHWYHMDMNYRACHQHAGFLRLYRSVRRRLVALCRTGKAAPANGLDTAWLLLLDWVRPPRQQNSTSFFYAHTDQWRYETLELDEVLSPLADKDKMERLAD